MRKCTTIAGQHSLCDLWIHPASSSVSSVFFPNHLPKFVLDIATDGMAILYCFSFLLLRRYSFNSLLRSAIFTCICQLGTLTLNIINSRKKPLLSTLNNQVACTLLYRLPRIIINYYESQNQ